MWFMNKFVNPIVRLILQSPLHGIMSTSLLLITYQGRKSGKAYTLPVQYIQDDHLIYILPGAPEQKTWWRNLRGGAPVSLQLVGKTLSGKADVFEGIAGIPQITQGLILFLQRFPAAAKMHGVHVDKDGSFDKDEVSRVATSTVVVRVELDS